MRCRKSGANIYLIIVMALLFTSADRRSTISAAEPGFALIVRSGEGRETRMSLSEIAKLPRTRIQAKDEKGKDSVWEGPLLSEVLRAGGVKFGEAIRGNGLANYVLAGAADGYRVVFALPEMDPAFTDLTFLLADRRDGQPLGEVEGKLRIVVPHEKRHARWVRQVVALSIRRP